MNALDAATGDVQWRALIGSIQSSPTVVNDTVYIGNDDNNIYALDAATGNEQWRFTTEGPVRSSPTVANGTVFVGSWDDNVYALDAATGNEQWHFTTGDFVESSPTVANGTVFVGSDDNNVYALDADTGDEQWRFTTNRSVRSSPTVANGTVFIGSYDEYIYALDASSGDEYWRFITGNLVESSPTVANGTVFVGSRDNRVYAIDAGVEGSSEGSRVMLGTLGHHHEWTGEDPAPPENTGTVTGTVTNTDSEPLTDVQIEAVNTEIETTSNTATTDTNGEYEIDLSANVTYEITANLGGFDPSIKEVTVNENETHTVNFTLSQQYAEFEAAAENKLKTATELDENAIYFSESDSVEALLSDFREGLQSGQFDDEAVPTEAVNRHRFAEETTNRLIVQTGAAEGPIGEDQQIAVTTTSFFVEMGVTLALGLFSFTDLMKNTSYGSLVPDSELAADELNGAIEELVSLAFPEEIVDNAFSEIIDTAQGAYDQALDGEFENAEEFNQAISDSITETVSNLTLQQAVETGSGFTPLQDRLSIEILDQLVSAESSLNYLQENLDTETVQENGLQGNRDGAVTAEDQATAQINDIASTTSTFLNELENRLDILSIVENSYELITGVQEGRSLANLAQLAASLVAATGPVVATVRIIGTLVGEVSLRLMMTANARGVLGIERGDPVGMDDIAESLPNANDTIEDLASVDDRWGGVA